MSNDFSIGILGDAIPPISNLAIPDFTFLYAALHVNKAKARLQTHLGYGGKLYSISPEAWKKHLCGTHTLGMRCVDDDDRCAIFAGIDVDENFEGNLPYLRAALLDTGAEALSQATFVTEGSDAGRGKVIITFATPVPRLHARALVDIILAAAVRRGFQVSVKSNCSLRPTEHGDGGLLRILGRNAAAKRSGPIERAFTLSGEALVDGTLRPLTAIAVSVIEQRFAEAGALSSTASATVSGPPSGLDTLPIWAARIIHRPHTWETVGGHQGLHQKMVALARAFLCMHGDCEKSQQDYRAALEFWSLSSPELSMPSGSGDTRNPLQREDSIMRAWNYACANSRGWNRKPLDQISDRVRTIYTAVANFVDLNGLRRHCFSMSLRQIGKICSKDQMWATRTLKEAEAAGFAVVHDKGRSRMRTGARTTLLGLIGEGETADAVRQCCETIPAILERKADRNLEASKKLVPKEEYDLLHGWELINARTDGMRNAGKWNNDSFKAV
jgi:hypothetical protein